jgi:hypothetical protein
MVFDHPLTLKAIGGPVRLGDGAAKRSAPRESQEATQGFVSRN